MTEIRKLKESEIECRVQTIKKNGCSLLLYKDARVDMAILDEVFGSKGWQRTHEVINGNLFCNIDIWDEEKKVWVRKQDVGTESMTEKEKGQASDSFKRAGFNVGIGRELYTAPFIWIKLNDDEITERGGKYYLNPGVKFTVRSVDYTDNAISGLIIVDNKNAQRYSMSGSTNLNNATKPTVSKTKTAPKKLEVSAGIREEMEKAATIEELLAIWSSNKPLQAIQEFVNLLGEHKKRIGK